MIVLPRGSLVIALSCLVIVLSGLIVNLVFAMGFFLSFKWLCRWSCSRLVLLSGYVIRYTLLVTIVFATRHASVLVPTLSPFVFCVFVLVTMVMFSSLSLSLSPPFCFVCFVLSAQIQMGSPTPKQDMLGETPQQIAQRLHKADIQKASGHAKTWSGNPMHGHTDFNNDNSGQSNVKLPGRFKSGNCESAYAAE